MSDDQDGSGWVGECFFWYRTIQVVELTTENCSVAVFKSRLPGFLLFLYSLTRCLAPVPLKLRPYGAIQMCLLSLLLVPDQRPLNGCVCVCVCTFIKRLKWLPVVRTALTDDEPCILRRQARRNERLTTGLHTPDTCARCPKHRCSSHRHSRTEPGLDWQCLGRLPTEGAELLVSHRQHCWHRLSTTNIHTKCHSSSSTLGLCRQKAASAKHPV